jgi:hypothetical protein
MSLCRIALLGGAGSPSPDVGVGDGDALGVGEGVGVSEGVGLGEGVGLLVLLPTLNPTVCEKTAPVESHALITAVWLPMDAATDAFTLPV